MSVKRTVFAGLIFFICVALYIVDNSFVQKKKIDKEIDEALTHIQADKIETITIKNENGEFEISKNSDNEWMITKPEKFNADINVVETILNNLNGAKKHNILNTKNFKDYGLVNPKINITISGRGIEGINKETIYIGDDSTYTGKVFAKSEGENKIYTVSEHIKNNINRSLFDFRDKTIIKINKDKLSGIEIENEYDNIILKKVAEEEKNPIWKITSPFYADADQKFIENILSKIVFKKVLKSSKISNEDKNKYGFENPKITIRFYEDNNSQVNSLIIGNKIIDTQRYYAKRENDDLLLEIPEDLTNLINIRGYDLRNRNVFIISPENLFKINIKAGKSITSLIYKDDIWKFEDDENTKVDQEKVYKYISVLKEIRIKEFTNDNPENLSQYGLEIPLIEVKTEDKDGNYDSILTGLKDEEKKITYVKTLKSKTVCGIDWTIMHKLLSTKEDFIDKRLLSFIENEITSIKIIWEDDKYNLLKEDSLYLCVKENGDKFKLEPEKTTNFLSILKSIKFEYIIKGDIISNIDIGLDEPKIIISIIGKDNNILSDLIVGNTIDNITYVKSFEIIYKIDKKYFLILADALTKIFEKNKYENKR